MILYQSDTDNLIIESRGYVVECRYGQRVIDRYLSTLDPISDVRKARQWVIANRWNGNV